MERDVWARVKSAGANERPDTGPREEVRPTQRPGIKPL